MRTYKTFAGNIIQLNSKEVLITTPFCQELCPMKDIRFIRYEMPHFTRNGIFTIVTPNNVYEIYFMHEHVPLMNEAFSIINALAKDNPDHTYPLLGKDGTKLGKLNCSKADHELLREPGRMTAYVLPVGFRFECRWSDNGCTIPFEDIEAMVLFDKNGEELFRLIVRNPDASVSSSSLDGVKGAAILYRDSKNALRSLEFSGRGVDSVAPKLLTVLVKHIIEERAQQEGTSEAAQLEEAPVVAQQEETPEAEQ